MILWCQVDINNFNAASQKVTDGIWEDGNPLKLKTLPKKKKKYNVGELLYFKK